MAMEDAIEPASQLMSVARDEKNLDTALPDYASNAGVPVAKIQSAAVSSTLIETASVTLAGRVLDLTVTDGAATVNDRRGSAVTAPRVELPSTTAVAGVKSLTAGLPERGSVVINGPATLPRGLIAEDARLVRGLTVVVAGAVVSDPLVAETMILSGRTDAVARLRSVVR